MRLIHVPILFSLLYSLIGFSQRFNVSELTLSDNKYTLNSSPYNGKAYVLTATGQLKEEFTLENGMMNGLYEFFKIDDRYDKSKFIDTISIAKKRKMIEEVKMDISKLQKDSIRNLDSIWILEEELFGGRIFKQLESIEVLKRKEKQKKLSEKYTDDKLNKKKEGIYNTYADVHKKFIDCKETLAAYRFRLKAHNEWLVNEKNKPIYKNILSETFTYARGIQTGTHVVYTKNGDKEVEETLDNGKKNGLYKRYSGNKIVEEGNYADNEKDGVWTTLNSSEKIIQNYSNGKLNGAYKKYNNDVLVETGQFMNGLMTGVWKFYYLNGKIKGEGSFTNGDGGDVGSTGIPRNGRDGLWILYNENGNKTQECSYIQGKIEGKFISYHENGNISSESNLLNGKIEGETFHFYSSGQKQYIINYVNGVKEGSFTEYYENGNNKRKGFNKNGTRNFEKNIEFHYDENGSNEKKYEFVNEQWVEYISPEEADKRLKELYYNNNKIVSCNWCGREFKYGKGYDYAHYK